MITNKCTSSDDWVQKLLVSYSTVGILQDNPLLYYSCKNTTTGEESSETTVGGL